MKKILFIFVILLWGCNKIDLPLPLPPVVDIFTVSESSVTDGQEIVFDLKTDGIYTLTIINKETSQVLTRERFTGKVGKNKLNIYTKTLSVKTLYLLLEDSNKTEVGKTTVVIN
jgi:hypothetical protein